MRIIKKYPNRRLYDTQLGAYITLGDIKQLVVNHVDFEVIDVKTKKDLTQTTLLQIIAEQELTTTPIFSSAVLQNFIRFYHEKSQHMVSQYLEQALSLFMQQKDFFKNQWALYQQLLLSHPSLIEQTFKIPSLLPVKTASIKKENKTR